MNKKRKRKLVFIESPFRGDNYKNTRKYLRYAKDCVRDCFARGEIPFASHLLYTRKGILNDRNPRERKLGMEAGWAWAEKADLIVIYTDFGISDGMKRGIKKAKKEGRTIEYRTLKK